MVTCLPCGDEMSIKELQVSSILMTILAFVLMMSKLKLMLEMFHKIVHPYKPSYQELVDCYVHSSNLSILPPHIRSPTAKII